MITFCLLEAIIFLWVRYLLIQELHALLYNNEIWDELNVLHKNTAIYTGICLLLSEPLMRLRFCLHIIVYHAYTYKHARTHTVYYKQLARVRKRVIQIKEI